jgi:hypothetical protein
MDVRPWAILLMGFYSSICSAIHPEFHRFFLLSLSLSLARAVSSKKTKNVLHVGMQCYSIHITIISCFNVQCLSVLAKQLMYWFGRFPF